MKVSMISCNCRVKSQTEIILEPGPIKKTDSVHEQLSTVRRDKKGEKRDRGCAGEVWCSRAKVVLSYGSKGV